VTYSKEISRDNRGVFLFLVDQSRSMNKPFGFDPAGNSLSRAEAVANALNGTLEELINRCMRDEGVRDYFDIGIIGYGKTRRPEFCWRNNLVGRKLVPITEVAVNAEIVEMDIATEVRGQIINERIAVSRWIDPIGVDSTPMNATFLLAQATLAEWIAFNPDSFPPVIINITDGMANDVNSDQELVNTAKNLMNLGTTDGKVLLINCHISGGEVAPVLFPSSLDDLPKDAYARLLFEMSSELSPRHRSVIEEIYDRSLEPDARLKGMAFNADAVALLTLLDIGTRQAINVQPARFLQIETGQPAKLSDISDIADKDDFYDEFTEAKRLDKAS
jgi:hypothetical protein